MAHKSNWHLSVGARAKISEKVHKALVADEARDKAKRLEREELKHLEHEQTQHGYTSAEKQKIGNKIHRTKEADSTENSARAEARYRHELETRTYRAPHRRNGH